MAGRGRLTRLGRYLLFFALLRITKMVSEMMRRAGPTFVALLGAMQVSVTSAHGTQPAASTTAAAVQQEGLFLSKLPAVAARFEVQVLPSKRSSGGARKFTWYFFREAQRVAVVKGNVEEAWYRDEQGRVRFERTLHDDQRVVEYATGELTTLGVSTEWQPIATFLDARELATLKPVVVRGSAGRARPVLAGTVGAARLRVEWLPDLQLPAVAERREADGARVRFVLKQSAASAPPAWPQPGVRAADYLRIDAADFGDMKHDPIVRKAEAIDVGVGWRGLHHRH